MAHVLPGLAEVPGSEKTVRLSKEMRLSQVEHAPKSNVSDILSFYMGKNTPDRKDYIMENLVVPIED